jgi:hypothetical protein
VEIDLVLQLYSAGLQNLWNALAMGRCCWRKAVLTTGSRRSARLALFLQGAIFATGREAFGHQRCTFVTSFEDKILFVPHQHLR